MTIRQATLSDIPRLTALLQEILGVHHAVRPDIFQTHGQKFSADQLEQLLVDESRLTFVYEKEGVVCGHLFCQLDELKHPVLQDIRTLFVDDLCVDSRYRGQGIGEELYTFAVELAKDLDCHNLTLDVWNANAGALRFYQRQGMTPQKTRYEVRFDQKSEG